MNKILAILCFAALLSGCHVGVNKNDYPSPDAKAVTLSMYVSDIYESGNLRVAIINSSDLYVSPTLNLTNIPLGTKVWVCIRTNGVLVPLVE